MSISKNNQTNIRNNITVGKILATFFCVIMLRIFLDSFAYTVTNGQLFTWEHSVHALFYFSSIFLSFAILLFLLIKDSLEEILHFLSKVSVVILAVPFIDLLINKTQVASMYVTVGKSTFLKAIFHSVNPFAAGGITKGIYVSAYLTLILFFIFVYNKTKNKKKGLLAILGGYLIFFSYSILPSGFLLFSGGTSTKDQLIGNTGSAYLAVLKESWMGRNFSLNIADLEIGVAQLNAFYEIAMAQLFWLIIVMQVLVILFLGNRKLWNSFKTNLRLERVFNYALIATVGIVLSTKLFGGTNFSNTINVVTLACFYVLIALNAWFAAFVNDVEDIGIDGISNPERPLIKKHITLDEWRLLHKYIFALIVAGSVFLNKQTTFLIVLVQCAYYIYSTPPLRLKKHFVSSSILMGLATTIVAMSGFFLVSPEQQLQAFPLEAILIIGFSYALLSNIKDVKDYAGDKAENIQTMPVVFGLKKAKLLIAILYAVVFVAIPFWLSLPSLLPFALTASAFVFYLLIKKTYQEKYIFYTKFVYMLLLYLLVR